MAPDDEKEKAVTEQAARDALIAARDILAPLGKGAEGEVTVGEYMRHVLQAVKAVHGVQAAAQKLLDDEKDQYVTLDAFHIVASALWAVSGGDDAEDVHPYCIGSMPFLGFARACLVLEAAANYGILVVDHDDSWLSDSYVDEAIEAVTKAKAEDAAERGQ